MAVTRRWFWLLFALAVLLAAAWTLRRALLLLYVSSIFAVVLAPAVNRLHRSSLFGWRPSRGAALLLLVAAAVCVFSLLAIFALPPLISDVTAFAKDLPARLAHLRAYTRSIPLLANLDFSRLGSYLVAAVGGLGELLASAGSVLVDVFSGILLTAYLILDGESLLKSALSVLPPAMRTRFGKTLERAGRRMRHWLTGQAMLMLILGSASLVAFGAMRLPYFYLLAVFAGIANIVPLLGPILTVILAGLVAATDALWKVAGVLIFYLVYQQTENAFLTPRIMKSQVELSSAVVVIALLIGGELAGVAGALVAVPSAVLIAELAAEYLVHRPEEDASHDRTAG